MCSKGVTRSRKEHLVGITGIRCVDDLGSYLGFPLVRGRVTRSVYNNLVEKVQRRVASWKGKLLNKAGKVCLARSIVSAIPVCTMQSRFSPSSVCSKVDSMIRNFLWGSQGSNRSLNLVRWSTVTSPKKYGGMGLCDSRFTNIALLDNLVWSLLNELDKLWVQVSNVAITRFGLRKLKVLLLPLGKALSKLPICSGKALRSD